MKAEPVRALAAAKNRLRLAVVESPDAAPRAPKAAAGRAVGSMVRLRTVGRAAGFKADVSLDADNTRNLGRGHLSKGTGGAEQVVACAGNVAVVADVLIPVTSLR